MPKNCAYCTIGVTTFCTEEGCDNPVCPTHSDPTGRCLNDGVSAHKPVEKSAKRSRAKAKAEEPEAVAAEEVTKEPTSEEPTSEASAPVEPSKTEPLEAPRRRRSRAAKTSSE